MGPYHVELVLERNVATTKKVIWVYLQNHMFEGVPSNGTSVLLKLTDGSESYTALLTPNGPESLSGIAVYSDHAELLAAVTVTDRDGKVYTETFRPFAR